ncbi:MAG: STAS domain-containing protein [Coriobacteriaceae bacterium]|nr:STAS domain-containing protein [Coriobacteriaceae bacterium]
MGCYQNKNKRKVQAMEINTKIGGTSATMSLAGTLTVASSPDLEAACESLPDDVVDITLDLTDLEYVASAGLRVIVTQVKKAQQRGGSMRLANPSAEVMEVLDVTGLVEILDIV